ncbi:CoA-transferase [Streptomyces sp. NPDC002680]|uniref:CoA-transferase n=1 Tax=Streptomyces sp. NPDC002680 TaxID=3364659 RepID=UPI0036CA44F3
MRLPGRGVQGVELHTTRDGDPKIVQECSLPLTGRAVVDRIIADLAVIDVTDDGLVLRELAPGVTFEQVRRATVPLLTPAHRVGLSDPGQVMEARAGA